MKEIKIKTNYNFLLFHFVDSASKWSRYIGTYIYDFLDVNWNLTEEDKKQLEKYKKAREKFGHEEEAKLFAWAYGGFEGKPEYKILLEVIKYFEPLKDKKGITLNQILKNKLKEVEFHKQKIEENIKTINLEETIQKMMKLFDFEEKERKSINAYLAHSMLGKMTGGGATGGVIHLEIGRTTEDSTRVLVHEYLHIRLPMGRFFWDYNNFYKKKTKLNENSLSETINEAITYSLSDMILFQNHTVNERIATYEKLNIPRSKEIGYIWKVAKVIEPIVREYLEKGRDPKETFDNLDKTFREFVKNEV